MNISSELIIVFTIVFENVIVAGFSGREDLF